MPESIFCSCWFVFNVHSYNLPKHLFIALIIVLFRIVLWSACLWLDNNSIVRRELKSWKDVWRFSNGSSPPNPVLLPCFNISENTNFRPTRRYLKNASCSYTRDDLTYLVRSCTYISVLITSCFKVFSI